jgi:hypothetical protein
MTDIVFEEQRGDYLERWTIDPPAPGVRYQVLQDEWGEDYTVRTIHRIQLVNT